MENIIDLIAVDSSPSEISDAIKSALYTKSMERIELAKPIVANSLFGGDNDDAYEAEYNQDEE